VDMHTHRQKGVVQVQVGILNRDQFPYTTDLVFGTKGYEITFTVEKDDFVPVVPPVEDHRSKDDTGNGNEGKPGTDSAQNKDKSKKMNLVQWIILIVPPDLPQCRLHLLLSLKELM
jgi:hypothetical protein